MKKKYILFDLDGTLTDPYEGITKSVQYALAAFGYPDEPQESLKKFIGPPLHVSFMEYYGFDEEKAQAAVAIYRERFSRIGIFENALFDGVTQLLAALKDDGRILGIASSKPQVFVDRILAHFHIQIYFDVVCGSFLDGRRTDKAEVIETAIGMLGSTNREEIVMVGDRLHDVQGARQAGIDCIGAAFGYGGRAELVQAGASCVVDTVGELQQVLLKL